MHFNPTGVTELGVRKLAWSFAVVLRERYPDLINALYYNPLDGGCAFPSPKGGLLSSHLISGQKRCGLTTAVRETCLLI